MAEYDRDADRLMKKLRGQYLVQIGGVVLVLMVGAYLIYTQWRIDVPAKHIAVLVLKTGDDIANHEEVAKSDSQKGVQLKVLTEGRYFRNPYTWDWAVYPMIEIPAGKMGVRIRMYGDDLPYGHYVATEEGKKGIVKDVLRPGRYAINAIIKGRGNPRSKSDFVEVVELHDPVTIPAGYKGVVTNLAGPMPDDPNKLLVDKDKRGVQDVTYDPGTYYVNPYMYRIDLIDCRSQRFNLATNKDMGFPSKDGFWVNLDGIIEFRVKPEKAAEVYVTYKSEEEIDQEIINKIILPNARAFCRLQGSNSTGRDFIGGETRIAFQKAFQLAMKEKCEPLGIEIIQALITRIDPPQAIAGPVRDREVAAQKLKQYTQQILQQASEIDLAKQKELIKQKQALIEADRKVVTLTVDALQRQQVAVTKAKENLAVAQFKLDAAKDEAEAKIARKKAEAGVIEFENQAEAAGWKKAVEALGGDGYAYARYILFQKLAPGYKSIMSNTANSPLMKVFEGFIPEDKSNGNGKPNLPAPKEEGKQ